MKKILLTFSTSVVVALSPAAHANWYQDIINAITKQGGITNNWLATINSQESALLESQLDLSKLVTKMDEHFVGHSGWGTYHFHDYQSYGDSASNWSSVMQMASSGQGSGDLGHVIESASKDFPSNNQVFNRGISDPTARNYYAVKSRTILATRAASQLDYNKIHEQIIYQQMLQQQIEKTKDIKAALDLSNRIQVESNLISLEILRQSALSNQQQAISEQASLNSSLDHAKFLTKE